MMTQQKRERSVLAVTFGLTNVALFLFAILPLSTVIVVEVMVAFFSTVSGTLVALTMSDRAFRVPAVRLAYLATATTALYTLMAFLATTDYDYHINVPITAFLLADAAGGYAAHILLERVNPRA